MELKRSIVSSTAGVCPRRRRGMRDGCEGWTLQGLPPLAKPMFCPATLKEFVNINLLVSFDYDTNQRSTSDSSSSKLSHYHIHIFPVECL